MVTAIARSGAKSVEYDFVSDDVAPVSAVEPFIRDLAVVGPYTQLRYDEARAFRNLCFNDSEKWSVLVVSYFAKFQSYQVI